MDDNVLKEARRRAENAVGDMPSGELKVKAFEVILAHLLGSKADATELPVRARSSKRERVTAVDSTKSLSQRILALQAEDFFRTPRGIAAIREGLQSYGWHYPVTTLSGTLQTLVQRRQLRRERVREGKKLIWKYSNP